MLVLVVGATGAVGTRLVSQLVARSHRVVGTSRSAENAVRLRSLGAEPLVLDLLDADAVVEEVGRLRPDAIVHEATALSGKTDYRHFDATFEETNLLRTRGTDALLAAVHTLGLSPRIVAQSFAGWPYARTGGPVKTETDAFDPDPPEAMRETLAAIRHLEAKVEHEGGVVLRYGGLYGAPDDPVLELVRKRRFPIVGDGGGIWSFVHLDDAAWATVLAVERDEVGIYNVVDDEPAPVAEWLPLLAATIGAKEPRHVPRWLGQLVGGEVGVVLMTEIRGASNAKAKRELGWTLQYPTWRKGFPASYLAETSRAA